MLRTKRRLEKLARDVLALECLRQAELVTQKYRHPLQIRTRGIETTGHLNVVLAFAISGASTTTKTSQQLYQREVGQEAPKVPKRTTHLVEQHHNINSPAAGVGTRASSTNRGAPAHLLSILLKPTVPLNCVDDTATHRAVLTIVRVVEIAHLTFRVAIRCLAQGTRLLCSDWQRVQAVEDEKNAHSDSNHYARCGIVAETPQRVRIAAIAFSLLPLVRAAVSGALLCSLPCFDGQCFFSGGSGRLQKLYLARWRRIPCAAKLRLLIFICHRFCTLRLAASAVLGSPTNTSSTSTKKERRKKMGPHVDARAILGPSVRSKSTDNLDRVFCPLFCRSGVCLERFCFSGGLTNLFVSLSDFFLSLRPLLEREWH